MTERRGTKALELWCRRITDGYPGVNVQNMTTSWRDGLAFCAMIHHFRPDLIDFDSLNKDDVYGNNELAFRTAAEHLGIPALLDAEDMASCSVPDRLSILTYLSQFYQNFGGSSPSRLALSRTKESSNEGINPVVAEPTKPKMGPRVMGMRREACAVCGMPVFLAEKLMISRSPYHRTCFRCARCNNQLTPGNYYETEEGQYCCETCPDEEQIKSSTKPIFHQAYNDAVMLGGKDAGEKESNLTSGYQRSLSDEEKTERRGQFPAEINDRLVHLPGSLIPTEKKYSNEALVAENISQTAQMRLNFMANNMLSTNLQEDSENSASNDEEYSSGPESSIAEGTTTQIPGDNFPKTQSPQGELTDNSVGDGHVDTTNLPLQLTKHPDCSNEPHSVDISKSSSLRERGSDKLDDRLDDVHVYETDKSFDTATSQATQHNNNNNNHRYSYLDYKDASVRQDTKDTLGLDIDCDANERQQVIPNTSQCLSLVQRRLKMFENPDTGLQKDETKMNTSVSRYVDEISRVDGKSMTYQTNKINQDNRPIGQPQLPSDNMEIQVNQDIDFSSHVEVVDEEEEKDKKDEKNEKNVKEEKDENYDKDEKDISTNAVSTEKLETNVPPIVPKRLALEARKNAAGAASAKLKAKNAEVTVLNAPGIDLSAEEIYPEDLNPFKSDEEGDTETIERSFENSRSSKISTNPFGSSDEEENEEVQVVAPPRPAVRNNISSKKSPEEVKEEDIDGAPTKRRLKAPQIHLNPFWSDDDEDDDDHYSMDDSLPAVNTPVPKPRTIKQTPQKKREFERGDIYASNSSLGSTGSTSTPGGTYRKKKPAPPPPIAKELFTIDTDSLLSPNQKQPHSSNNSLHTTPRARKAKPAPPPPMSTSTPYTTSLIANLTLTESPITDSGKIMKNEDYKTWEEPKIGKDEANRNTQSNMSCDETNLYGGGYTDKSVQGKWKRKKGPAPARPIPHRRKIKVMSLKDVKLELDEIEMQQQGLEKQGVRLEQLIRDKAESGNAPEETSLGMDAEELVLELFVLVNEKNELFRRQAELMLLRRQQRLEEEHADIEYQIRCLLCQPEATKTDFDKQREETLIQRLVEIVERRNEIVECLEMDRRREVEEDRSINTQMGLYAAKNKQEFRKELEDEEKNRSRKSKKSKLKEKAKEKILRKGHKKDADKDVDETEIKIKRQNKRKWF